MQPVTLDRKVIKNAYRFVGHSSGVRTIIGWKSYIISGSDDKTIKVLWIVHISNRYGIIKLVNVFEHFMVILKESFVWKCGMDILSVEVSIQPLRCYVHSFIK